MNEVLNSYGNPGGFNMPQTDNILCTNQQTNPMLPYNNVRVSQKTFEALIRNDQELFNTVQKRRVLNSLDLENFQKKQDYKEEIKIWRDLSPTSLYWDARGRLKMEVFSLNRVVSIDEFCNLQELKTRVVVYRPMTVNDSESPIYMVSYQIGEHTYQIAMPEKDCGRGKLLRKMQFNGVSFYLSPRKLNGIAIDFEAFILKRAEVVFIPLVYGWNLCDEKWYFVSEKDLIWEDIRNGKYD
jgi:hypothetical protein